MKLLLVACILATCGVAMGWELEQENHLARPEEDLSKICSDLILQVSDCISFMADDGNDTKPDSACCKGFRTLLDTNAKCVCFAIESAPSMGIAINMSRAEVLPSLCHVKAPPISKCNISSSPVPSPSTPGPSPATPAPAPGTPNPPAKPPSAPAVPSPPPVSPTPPSAAPAPGTPPSSPATPPSSPVSPTPPSSSPTPAAPSISPSEPIVTPSTEAPASSPKHASGAMHIQIPFLVSFAVIVVSLFFV